MEIFFEVAGWSLAAVMAPFVIEPLLRKWRPDRRTPAKVVLNRWVALGEALSAASWGYGHGTDLVFRALLLMHVSTVAAVSIRSAVRTRRFGRFTPSMISASDR